MFSTDEEPCFECNIKPLSVPTSAALLARCRLSIDVACNGIDRTMTLLMWFLVNSIIQTVLMSLIFEVANVSSVTFMDFMNWLTDFIRISVWIALFRK